MDDPHATKGAEDDNRLVFGKSDDEGDNSDDEDFVTQKSNALVKIVSQVSRQ
jgi:hypothetical protein